MINDNPDLVNNLLMSDEVHFQLLGFVSKQNFHYLSSENPQRFHEKLLHSVKVTIWYAISSFGIVGPYFFEDGDGHTVTVNSQRYVSMFENFLGPELVRYPVNEDTFFSTRWCAEPHLKGFHEYCEEFLSYSCHLEERGYTMVRQITQSVHM
jgi:hypothetical protein